MKVVVPSNSLDLVSKSKKNWIATSFEEKVDDPDTLIKSKFAPSTTLAIDVPNDCNLVNFYEG